MSQDNQITLRGYLTADPRFRQATPMATPWAEIRMGSTLRRLNRETGEWQDGATSYYTVKCWRRLAINAVSSLHKGDRVVVRGRLYLRSWVDNQERPRISVEIEADTLGHDLAYGWTHYMPGSRQQAVTRPADGAEQATAGQEPASRAEREEEYRGTYEAPEEDAYELDEAANPDDAVSAAEGAEGVNGTDGAADARVLAGVGANMTFAGLAAEVTDPAQ